MAYLRIDYDSEAMLEKTGVSVIIPENKWGYSLADRPADYKYPVVWLLCGGGFDYTDWQRYSAVELFAAQHGVVIVMPGISYAAYCDTAEGDYKYWTQISRELPEYLRKLLPLSEKREDNFVAGFSMGGYGAFKWAMQAPQMFAACGTFAGPIGIIPRQPIPSDERLGQPCVRDDFCEPQFRTLWASIGSAAKRRNTPDDNLYMLEQHLKKKRDLPKFYIAIGSEDPTHDEGYAVMDQMRDMGLEFKDIRDHGGHDWEYCNRHIEDFLNWIPLGKTYKMEVQ
ncbi:S-formylglutathione hydrolase FrmB [Lachnospiraceae bacterium NK3A20]|nr:S-formylglutathione hydrolase FrmB [Lachnospiraceae bacterium NK3A20]